MASSKVTSVLSLSDKEVKELFATLSGIDDSARGVFSLKLTEDEWKAVPGISEAVAYQGFDPRKVIIEFMKKAKAHAVEDAVPKTVMVGTIPLQIYESTNAKNDLLFLLTLFLTRGNNVAKILLKCDTSIRDTISRKCSQYGIDASAKTGARNLGPSVITLARLSQAFAPATATIIIGHGILGNLKTRLFPGVSLPLIMTHTIFPGLLRSSDLELIEIAKFLNLETSIMLSTPKDRRKMEQQQITDLLEQSDSFVMAAVNGSMTPDSVKKKILVKAGLITDKEAQSVTVQAMVAMCSRLQLLKNETYQGAIKKMSAALETTPPRAADPNE